MSMEKLRDSLVLWDQLADAHKEMALKGCDFGDIVTRRGEAMEALIHAARNVTTDHELLKKDYEIVGNQNDRAWKEVVKLRQLIAAAKTPEDFAGIVRHCDELTRKRQYEN